MEYDLRGGLVSLTDAPVPGDDELALETIARRVRRGRAVRTGAVTVVGVAAAIGLVMTVHAAPWQEAPQLPASPSPTTPAPEPTSSPEPTTEPEPEPEPDPEPEVDPPVTPTWDPVAAVRVDGALVLLDPLTGETLRVLADDVGVVVPHINLALGTQVTVAPDGSAIYLAGDFQDEVRVVRRVAVDDGSTTVVAESGTGPALSPDGSTLAHQGIDPEAEQVALVLQDVATGATRYIPIETDLPGGFWIGQPAWSADSSRLYVECCSGDYPSIRVVDTADAGIDLDEPGYHPPGRASWRYPTLLSDGRLAVSAMIGDGEEPPDGPGVLLLDPSTGEIVEELTELTGVRVSDLAARRGEVGLLVLEADGRLLRWDPTTGLHELATGIAGVGW